MIGPFCRIVEKAEAFGMICRGMKGYSIQSAVCGAERHLVHYAIYNISCSLETGVQNHLMSSRFRVHFVLNFITKDHWCMAMLCFSEPRDLARETALELR